MATHSTTLAWKIPWTEEPGSLRFTGLQRVGHGSWGCKELDTTEPLSTRGNYIIFSEHTAHPSHAHPFLLKETISCLYNRIYRKLGWTCMF